MKTGFKFLYWVSIVFIIFCSILMILLKTLPLEFSNGTYNENFDSIFFLGIPIAILLTLSRLGFKAELSKAQIKSAIVSTVFIAAVCFILFVVYAFATFASSMCVWSSGETLYQNKTKKSQKIIARNFGCGATDSSPATVDFFKVQQITPLFIYVVKVDTSKLDKSQWISVRN